MFENRGDEGAAGLVPVPPAGEHSAPVAAGAPVPAGQRVSVGGPVSVVRVALAGVEALARDADATFAAGWGFEERARVIAMLDRIGELTGLYRARVLAAHRDDGRWASSGDRSFEQHRARTSGAGVGAARAEMEFADGLAALPQAARAVQEEQVSAGHAQVLTRLRARCSARVKDALERGGAGELLAEAAGLDVPAFARRAAAWAAARDTDAAEASFAAVRARRYLRLVERDGGGLITGFLDPLALATLRTAVGSHTPVPAVGDERTPGQRAADALEALAQASLGAGATKLGAQIRPHLSLIVAQDTWTAIQRRRHERDHDAEHGSDHHGEPGDERGAGHGGEHGPEAGASDHGGGPTPEGSTGHADPRRPGEGVDAPSEGHHAGRHARVAVPEDRGVRSAVVLPELDDGTVVPLSQLERIACDCEMTRLVLDADGIPLDVGQTQRTYSQGLRRAILTRDGHCQWPGCDIRASWCQVHHIRWFSRGGPTSLENGISLCSFHHHEVHRHDITITPHTRGVTFTRPDATTIGTTPRNTSAARMLPTRRTDRRKTPVPVAADAGSSGAPGAMSQGAARSAGRPTTGSPTPAEGGPSPPAGGLF